MHITFVVNVMAKKAATQRAKENTSAVGDTRLNAVITPTPVTVFAVSMTRYQPVEGETGADQRKKLGEGWEAPQPTAYVAISRSSDRSSYVLQPHINIEPKCTRTMQESPIKV